MLEAYDWQQLTPDSSVCRSTESILGYLQPQAIVRFDYPERE
jgi:hypothetical protein